MNTYWLVLKQSWGQGPFSAGGAVLIPLPTRNQFYSQRWKVMGHSDPSWRLGVGGCTETHGAIKEVRDLCRGYHRSWRPLQSCQNLGPRGHLFLLVQVQVCFLKPYINTSHRTEEKCRNAPMSFPDVVQTQNGKTVLSSAELICFGITKRLMHWVSTAGHIFHWQCFCVIWGNFDFYIYSVWGKNHKTQLE